MILSPRPLAVTACCAVALLTGCGGDDDGTATLRIDAIDGDYDRDVYEVGPGPVTLEFRNLSSSGHNIVFRDVPGAPDAPGLRHPLMLAGESPRTFELELVEGEFEFFCSVPGHERVGMVGTLVVR